MLVPILACAYVAGATLGIGGGMIATCIGYLLSTVFYYEIGRFFHETNFVRSKLDRLQQEFPWIGKRLPFPYTIIVGMVPFLPGVLMLPRIAKSRLGAVAGLFVGSAVAVVPMVISGAYAMDFVASGNVRSVIISLLIIALLVPITTWAKRNIRPRG